ncbi:hypothetical protein [Paenibacillus sp. MMS18-CY102]|nr:hypothetical protein [Paenibacillus sp. MMS18-CY102]
MEAALSPRDNGRMAVLAYRPILSARGGQRCAAPAGSAESAFR